MHVRQWTGNLFRSSYKYKKNGKESARHEYDKGKELIEYEKITVKEKE
jgi:hypothetical protein